MGKKAKPEAPVKLAVDHPMMIRCSKCRADIRTKDCGCDASWITEELHPVT